jgi:L,D-transpeptidase catalytic domain
MRAALIAESKMMFTRLKSAIYGVSHFTGMNCLRHVSFLAPILFALLGAGCVTSKKQPTAAFTTAPLTSEPSYWKGDGVTGVPKIVVSLGKQRAYFYRGKTVVGEAKISTGRKGFETPPGKYRVLQKDKDHVSNLYGEFVDELSGEIVKNNVDISKEHPLDGTIFQGAKMPYFLRFREGYGLHAGRLPGRRASHGCIRLPHFMAEHFFNNSETGTPVIVEN